MTWRAHKEYDIPIAQDDYFNNFLGARSKIIYGLRELLHRLKTPVFYRITIEAEMAKKIDDDIKILKTAFRTTLRQVNSDENLSDMVISSFAKISFDIQNFTKDGFSGAWLQKILKLRFLVKI